MSMKRFAMLHGSALLLKAARLHNNDQCLVVIPSCLKNPAGASLDLRIA